MCKKRKTSVTHSKTTHINKIASPGGGNDGKEAKKKSSSWTYFLCILTPINSRKTGQCLVNEVCLSYKNLKVEPLIQLHVERGGSGMITLEKKKNDMPDRPRLSVNIVST